MEKSRIIGLDLGGTFIKATVLEGRSVGPVVSLETNAEKGPKEVIQRLRAAALLACAEAGLELDEVIGIGVGSPGPLRLDRGVILKSANLPGWQNVPLCERLAALTGRPITLTNDANAAVYGEYRHGAGQGAGDLCMLTLGTGVGGGVMVGGELIHGHFDNAGELGHLLVLPGQGKCVCGQDGCLEAFAGSSALRAAARELGAPHTIDVPDIIVSSDPALRRLWERCCQAIALACINLQHTLNPQRILLGGGMSAAGTALLQPVLQAFQERTWHLTDDVPEIRLASLGNNAGAIGAAEWFRHQHLRGAVAFTA